MKIIELIFVLFLLTFLSSCGLVREGFTNQKKNSSDEFLVEKKSPLTMPPDFEKLPLPKSNNLGEAASTENNDDNIKKLILNNETTVSEINNDSNENVRNFEKSLIEKIKDN